jgi:ABC-type multidrug transport system ATPase subunit
MKGCKPENLTATVQSMAEQVELDGDDFYKQSRQLSGGMRRRLSIGIALIGNPTCVLFDEPTTGLDPETRQGIWRIIRNARKDRAVILTTHSMEEADALASRIGIMANGRMQCIGSQLHLKNRFGDGYELSISVNRAPKNGKTHAQLLNHVHEFVSSHVVDKVAGESKGEREGEEEEKAAAARGMVRTKDSAATNDPWTTMYSLPKEGVRVSQIFRLVEENKARLQIQEWGLMAPSLNDVFMRIALASEKRALQSLEAV